MTYVKQVWANGILGGTPISAERLAHIEDGIESLSTSSSVLAGLDPTGTLNASLLIQTALNTASVLGGIVLLPSGIFKLTSNVNIPSNVELHGMGRRATILSVTTNVGLRLTGVSHAAVRNLGMNSTPISSSQGISITAGSSDCAMENLAFNAGFGWSIFIGTASRRNRCINIYSAGTASSHNIEINDSHYNIIEDCHLIGNGIGGAVGSNNVEIYESTVAQKPTGNEVINSVLETATSAGVVDWGGVNTKIIGNTILNSGGYGIVTPAGEQTGGTASREGVCIGNIIKGAGAVIDTAGILISGDDWLVQSNDVIETSGATGGHGIWVFGNRNSIIGNVARLNQRNGIMVGGGAKHRIIGNNCVNNSAAGAGLNSGITVFDANDCVVSGNTCTDTRGTKLQSYGVLVQTGSRTRVIGNSLEGNLSDQLGDSATDTMCVLNGTAVTNRLGTILVGPVGAPDGGGAVIQTAGKVYLKGDNQDYTLGISRENTSSGRFYLGATADASPDLLLCNNAGTIKGRVTATGDVLAAGGVAMWGHAKPSVQPASPTTLSDVIAVLHSYGITAVAPVAVDAVANLSMWLKADALGLANNAAVSSWTDFASSPHHPVQATGGKQPLYKTSILNGLAIVRFDGVDDRLKTASFTLNQPITRFVVAKLNSTGDNQYIIDGNVINTATLLRSSSGVMGIYSGAMLASTGADTAWHIYCGVFNDTISRFHVDGGVGITGAVGSANPGGVAVGSSADDSLFASVDIAEVVAYSSVLTLDDINAVGLGLAAKYALTWTTAT